MGAWEASGQSDEWFTPKFVFDALGCEFDLDVAAPNGGGDCVPAHLRYSRFGLQEPWFGFVWMNPPFGGRNALVPWLDKFFEHGCGIALTPDRTSAPWFWDAWARADLVMFTRKIRFIRPDGNEGKSPSCGTALWVVGDKAVSALHRAQAAGLGIVGSPTTAHPSAVAMRAGEAPASPASASVDLLSHEATNV